MDRLNFRLEVRGDAVLAPLEIVSLKAGEVRPGRMPAMFSFADHSALERGAQAFDEPCTEGRYSACGLSFSLTPDFSGEEALFFVVERLGLPREHLIAECRTAISKWSVCRAKRNARVLRGSTARAIVRSAVASR